LIELIKFIELTYKPNHFNQSFVIRSVSFLHHFNSKSHIYPPPEDSLFQNFFFDLTGRFLWPPAGLTPETPNLVLHSILSVLPDNGIR